MARPSYLSRRDGGRYFLQIRVGNPAKALYGRGIMRAFLRTSDFSEARKRLMDSLGWARELIDAPDLEALGAVIHGRLQAYAAAGTPDNERALAERIGFPRHIAGNLDGDVNGAAGIGRRSPSTLETNGSRERISGLRRRSAVRRFSRDGPWLLGFYAHSKTGGECWPK